MTRLIDLLALSLLMLVTGIFWGPWFALTRSLNLLTSDEFIKITKILSANLGPTMRFMLPGTIAIMVVAVFTPGGASTIFYLGMASLLLVIATLMITVIIEVPIVKTVKSWTPATIPTDWQRLRDKWLRFHVARVLLSLTSFVCLAMALLLK